MGNIERSRRRLTSAGLFDLKILDVVTGQLEVCRPDLHILPAIPFLHDTTTRNVLVAGDRTFSGIVDVDDLCFGDPRYAPALTLAVLLGYGGPTRYVEHWMRLAGHKDDHIFRLYVALFLLDLMSEHGQSFNGNERPSTPDDRQRLLLAFSDVVSSFSG
jgi:hypothetical protein